MLSAIAQEEAKLEVMQRVWQTTKRGTSTLSLFEEEAERELFALPRQNSCSGLITRGQCVSPPPTISCSEVEPDFEIQIMIQEHQHNIEGVVTLNLELNNSNPKIVQNDFKPFFEDVKTEAKTITLDASELGDFPARYVITPVESHQFPVCGVYIDKRVIPGFKYSVRPLRTMEEKKEHPCLFGNRALTLQSIGRGYARRFTFEADKNCLNNNENYFWSDNRPEGYAFELEVISEGDKFTLFDANREAQGTVEVVKIEGPQIESSMNVTKESCEKRVKVKFIGKVEFFETGVAKPMPLTGITICIKKRQLPSAEITRVINISIKHHRYYLVPGVQNIYRRFTVRGKDINDVPTKYTMTGLEAYEIPVVGTYVDSRIIPGFHYKVRPNDRKDHLFDGRSLKLMSIGMGYAKRLTFEPDSLVNPDNYLWSDSHPDGLGLEPRAVHTGMKFNIMANNQILGVASVFRADMPQREEKMEKVLTSSGLYAIEKYIHIDVMCHVKLSIYGGGSADNEEEHLMRVYGLAIVRKEPKSNYSYIVQVDNVGLDSQLNLIFARSQTELTFTPIRI